MGMRVLLVLMMVLAADTNAAPQEYWVCVNAQGVRSAQDRPCAVDQQAISAPASAKAAPQAIPPLRIAPVSSPALPEAQQTQPRAVQPAANVFQPIIDVVWKGAGTIILLLVIIMIAKIMLAPRKGQNGEGRRRSAPAAAEPARHVPPEMPTADWLTQWSVEVLRLLEWKRFEELCEGYWKAKGYPARSTGPGADGGVDVVIADRVDSAKVFAVVQCKSWSKPVGVEPVRALWGSKDHFGAQLAMFYSLSGFSDDACTFAAGKHLKLIDGGELLRQVQGLPEAKRTALLDHVTHGDYTTPSCPKCEIKMVRKAGRNGKPDFWSCPQFASCRTRGFPVA